VYFNVNFNVFFKLIKVRLLVIELYIVIGLLKQFRCCHIQVYEYC